MKKTLTHGLITTGLILLTIFLVKRCEGEPKIVTKTKTVVERVTDTITETVIQDPIIKYVEKVKTEKGKDSIVYVEKPGADTVPANQYSATLKSDGATADLLITTSGELFDVSGTITYPKTTITNDITKIKAKSGAFLYFETQLNTSPKRFELGVDYQLRNKVLIGVSADYNSITKNLNANVKVGLRIF